MKKELYNAVARGESEKLEEFKSELEFQETHQKNTVLDVAVKIAAPKTPYESGGELGLIRKICELRPSLIGRANSKGDTPLHIAARGGRYDLVGILIDESRFDDGVLTMVNSKKDTALHEALRSRNFYYLVYKPLPVVEALIRKNEELSNLINEDSESPVFIAARKGLYESLELLLKYSTQYGGPGMQNDRFARRSSFKGRRNPLHTV
ncbi:hypothetical protein NE237_027217 [Protea cynaroides]|uniref:Uncharacterized protein n=1 Tax=Protea cynaroides TaxID=273540 RepID=A0A9Q0GN00_9MAGN|nr:hypothetical protein NE237_027217 [Protea cynaroides]